jgi:eukaryotic-like serine/threonine-protein kinase
MQTDPERWERVQELFHGALARPEAERAAWLAARCADEPELAAEVAALLESDAHDRSPLDADRRRLVAEVLDGSVPALHGVGPYRIVRVLGRGGMGVVYLGERDDLDARVAIKVLRDAALSPARRARFRREERTLAQLNHPSIARLYDADVLPDGTPYFVMEYVEGVPLDAYRRSSDQPLAERLRLFRAVCEAVQYAHRHAVIHRDLKPSNILVTAGGPAEEPTVKLLDFGIAKPLDEADTAELQTRTELRLMTPAYAAPEQLRGEPVGVFTDVHALGVILYELLTGRHPFEPEGLSPGQVEARVLTGEPARPSYSARGGGPAGVADRATWADLDVLCLTAMHPDPQRRYPTVEALLRDLDHLRDGEPLEARPDSVGYRLARFVRRNRRPVAAAMLGLGVIAGLNAYHTARLAEQRNEARLEAAKAAQVSEYLIGLFEAGDPYAAEPGPGDVRALLERGETRADELSPQPAVHATMLNVLARVYTQLGEFERAGPLAEHALALRRSRGEPLDVAESLATLARLHADRGELEAAEAALREALALRQRNLPPQHPDLAAALGALGGVLAQQGRYGEAETIHRHELRLRRARPDDPDPELGATLNRLAITLHQQGDYDAAERTYRQALAAHRAELGAEHPAVTRVLANLGMLNVERGDFAVAESLLTQALRIRRATLGSDHFETAIGLGQLGQMLVSAGEHARATPHLRESLEIRERILAPDHPSIATTLNGLALTLQHQGDHAGAEAHFRRAVEIYRSRLGDRHRFTAVARANLGDLLRETGDLTAAESELREAVGIMEEVHPANHQELAHNRGRLGAVLAAQGRRTEAEPLLIDSYRALESQLGTDHERTRQAASRLAALYEAWGRPVRAEPLRAGLDAGS